MFCSEGGENIAQEINRRKVLFEFSYSKFKRDFPLNSICPLLYLCLSDVPFSVLCKISTYSEYSVSALKLLLWRSGQDDGVGRL